METKDCSLGDKIATDQYIQEKLKQLARIKQRSNDLKVHHDTDNLDEDER